MVKSKSVINTIISFEIGIVEILTDILNKVNLID